MYVFQAIPGGTQSITGEIMMRSYPGTSLPNFPPDLRIIDRWHLCSGHEQFVQQHQFSGCSLCDGFSFTV